MENRKNKTISIQIGKSQKARVTVLELIVETAEDGQLWGRVKSGDDLLINVGASVNDLQVQFVEQFSDTSGDDYIEGEVSFDVKYDLKAFFDHYKALNITEIGTLAGINPSLLRQYKSGVKHPSKEQVKKIENAIHVLGKQLMEIELCVA